VTPTEREELLNAIAPLAIADATIGDVKKTFLPTPAHRLALREEIVVVLGAKGAGKSALARLLVDGQRTGALEPLFGAALPGGAYWFDAFSLTSTIHPGAAELDRFASQSSDEELRAFWIGHIPVALIRGVLALANNPTVHEKTRLTEFWSKNPAAPSTELLKQWKATFDEAAALRLSAPSLEQLPRVTKVLDDFERKLAEGGTTAVAVYDQFELLGVYDVDIRRRFIRALLAAWISLSNRYKRIRAKIFLGEDLFDSRWLNFPDASKLRPRAESLRWDVPSLYRAVVRHFAAAGEPTRRWLREVPGLDLRDLGDFGWMPGDVPDDVQRAFIERFTRRMMGTGIQKTYAHRWIPNQLQDGKGRIMPRMMLNLLGTAAREAMYRARTGRDQRLVEPEDLLAALQETSTRRAQEVRPEYPWIDVLQTLHGREAPFKREEFLLRIGTLTELPPGVQPRDAEAVLDDLLQLGVLRIDHDGRVDVPDIYRYFYGIRRTGGAAHTA
jgi:hypothetical protein